MKRPDLIATCWTTAGEAAPYPGEELSPFSVLRRVKAAARAGFTGFGLLDVDLKKFLEKGTYSDLRLIFADNGIDTVELEFLTRWWTKGTQRQVSDGLRNFLFEAADELGARHIKAAPDLNRSEFDRSLWADEFARLCEEAEARGTHIALEFLPMSNIPNLTVALDLFRAAGEPKAGGLMVDIWHMQRSGSTLDQLATTPLNAIKAVELDDADDEVVGSLYDDTVLRRKLLGQGDFPVEDFIAVLKGLGWDGPWGLEILSLEYRRRPLEEAVVDAFETTMRAFERAEERQSD